MQLFVEHTTCNSPGTEGHCLHSCLLGGLSHLLPYLRTLTCGSHGAPQHSTGLVFQAYLLLVLYMYLSSGRIKLRAYSPSNAGIPPSTCFPRLLFNCKTFSLSAFSKISSGTCSVRAYPIPPLRAGVSGLLYHFVS